MQKITPFLWFDGRAEEATNFYVSIFENSSVSFVKGDGENVFVTGFVLDGVEFLALNGGPTHAFTPAISLFVSCADQKEVDHFWDSLSEGGEVQHCGWLKDKFGISWQIVPKALGELMGDQDPARSGRVMQAMLQMVKLDVAGLQAAYDG